MTQRNKNVYKNKLGSLIKKTVMEIITNDIDDPRIKETVIKHVELNGDNTIAYIYFENIFSKLNHRDLENILEHSSGFIHIILKKQLRLKHVPKLIFRYDETTDYYFKISKKLNQVLEKDEDKKEKGDNIGKEE